MWTKKIIFIIFILFLLASPVVAATIYVDYQITPSSCSTYTIATNSCGAGSLTCYKTITGAVGAVSPGDTILIRTGTYTERVDSNQNASSGSKITLQNYSGESVIWKSTDSWAISQVTHDYWVFDGIIFDSGGNTNSRQLGLAQGADYIWIQNCTFRNSSGQGVMLDAYSGLISYVRILNNTFHDITSSAIYLYPTVPSGGSIQYVLIQGNTIYDCASSGSNTDGIQVGGQDGGCDYVIFKENRVYDIYGGGAGSTIDFGGHSDHWPTKYMWDSNDIYRGNRSSVHVKFVVQDVGIMRRNRITNLELYVYTAPVGYADDHRIYHNTFVTDGMLLYWDDATNGHQDCLSYYHKNNIFSSSGANLDDTYTEWPIATHIYYYGNYFHNTNGSASWGWGGETYGWGASTPKFAEWQSDYSTTVANNTLDKTSTLANLFTDPTNRDYTVKAGAGYIDTGVNLTTITSATGSGTSFTVGDSHYFCDGWNLITGDTIQVGSNQRVISSINYTDHIITVTASVSWTQGDGVNMVFSGSAPDPGAYEYQSGGSSPTGIQGVLCKGCMIR